MPGPDNKLKIVIEAEGGEAERKLKVLKRGLDILGDEAERTSRRSRRAFMAQTRVMSETARATSRLYRQMAALAGVVAGSMLARHVIETANSFTMYQQSLVTLEGSQAAAARKWQELLDLATTTPYKIGEVMDAYKMLRAFGLDPTIDTMRILGDTAAALGDPTALGRIALVLGQIKAQGKMMAQDMIQLANAGINAAEVMREAFGVSRDEVSKLADMGVTADQIIQALLDHMEHRFGGQMERLYRTMKGQWEELISYWQQTEDAIMKGGLEDYITGLLRGINAEIKRLKDEGKLDEWASNVGHAIITAFDVGLTAVERFSQAVYAVKAGIDFLIIGFDTLVAGYYKGIEKLSRFISEILWKAGEAAKKLGRDELAADLFEASAEMSMEAENALRSYTEWINKAHDAASDFESDIETIKNLGHSFDDLRGRIDGFLKAQQEARENAAFDLITQDEIEALSLFNDQLEVTSETTIPKVADAHKTAAQESENAWKHSYEVISDEFRKWLTSNRVDLNNFLDWVKTSLAQLYATRITAGLATTLGLPGASAWANSLGIVAPGNHSGAGGGGLNMGSLASIFNLGGLQQELAWAVQGIAESTGLGFLSDIAFGLSSLPGWAFGGLALAPLVGGLISKFFADKEPDHSWFHLETGSSVYVPKKGRVITPSTYGTYGYSEGPFGPVWIASKGHGLNDIGFDGHDAQRRFAQYVTDTIASFDRSMYESLSDGLREAFASGIPSDLGTISWRTDKKDQAEKAVLELIKARYGQAFDAVWQGIGQVIESASTQDELSKALDVSTLFVNTFKAGIPEFQRKFNEWISSDAFKATWEMVPQSVQEVFNQAIGDAFENFVPGTITSIEDMEDALKRAGQGIEDIKRLTGLYGQFVDTYTNGLSSIAQKVESFITEDAFKNIWGTIGNELKAQVVDFARTFTDLQDLGWVGNEEDIRQWINDVALFGENMDLLMETFRTANEMFKGWFGYRSMDLLQGQRSLSEAYQDQLTIVQELAANFDGTTSQALELSDALNLLGQSEMDLVRQIDQALGHIDSVIASARERIRLDNMTEEERYNYFVDQALSLYNSLGTITSPELMDQTVQEIVKNAMSAWNLLSPEEKMLYQQDYDKFLAILDEYSRSALNDWREQIKALHEGFVDNLQNAFQPIVENMVKASLNMRTAANDMQSAATNLDGAIPDSIPVSVTVNLEESTSEVGA